MLLDRVAQSITKAEGVQAIKCVHKATISMSLWNRMLKLLESSKELETLHVNDYCTDKT